MAINLNDTLPAAPAGGVNAKWQEDISGNVSAYVPTGGLGLLPILVAAVDKTAVHVNLSGTLFTTVLAGQYRIGSYIVVTNPSFYGVLPNVIIGWTDMDTGVVESNFVTDSIPGTTLGAYVSGEMRISCQASTNITYSTTGYGSYNQYGDLIYAIHLTCELV
jgi:hypothetical protein